MAIRPFHFHLQKIDSEQIQLTEGLLNFLPKIGKRTRFHEAVAQGLEKHVGQPIPFEVEAIHETDGHSFCEKLPDAQVVAVVGLPPAEEKCFLDIDPQSALQVIDRMLGGRSETPLELRPLSDIEQGVLQYLIIQLFAHIDRFCGKEARLRLRFERFVFEPEGLNSFVKADEPLIMVTVRLHIGDVDGFVRLCFPKNFIHHVLLDRKAIIPTEDERAHQKEALRTYDYVRVPVWAEVGRTTLKPIELTELEAGDVILLDRAELALADGEPEGKVIVRVGEGHEGGYIADLSAEKRKIHCRLIEGYRGEGE